MPSLNFIPGGLVTTTQALFNDSENSSFSYQKSLSDLDDGKKSSTDNFSSDSLLSETLNNKEEEERDVITPTPEAAAAIESVAENLLEKTLKVRDAVRNQNNDVWNSYYQSLKQGQTIIKGCF